MSENRPAAPSLLTKFLKKYRLSSTDLRTRLSPPVERQTVIRWCNGTRTPSVEYRNQIATITDGDVPADAWLDEDDLRVERLRAAWMKRHPVKAGAKSVTTSTDLEKTSISEGHDGSVLISKTRIASLKKVTPESSEKITVSTKTKAHIVPPVPSIVRSKPIGKHDDCSPNDPTVRRSTVRQFAVVSRNGERSLFNDFTIAKIALDESEDGQSIECTRCLNTLAFKPAAKPDLQLPHRIDRTTARGSAIALKELL